MTNDEARMTKEARNPNDEKWFRDSGFVILSSLGLRHSSFSIAPVFPARRKPGGLARRTTLHYRDYRFLLSTFN